MADPAKLDSQRLDEASARRLIERATELDARMKSQSTVADLREAAIGAGISEEAFQRALSEVREPEHPEARELQDISRRHRRLKMTAIIAAVVLVGVLGLFSMILPVRMAGHDQVSATGRPAPEAIEAPPAQMPVIPPPEQHRPVTKKQR